MCTSIVSVLTGIPVRKDVAMTGEITLEAVFFLLVALKKSYLLLCEGELKLLLFQRIMKKDLAEIPLNVKRGTKNYSCIPC